MSEKKEFEATVTISLKQFKELEMQADFNREYFLKLESIRSKFNKYELTERQYKDQIFNYVSNYLEE